MPSTTRGPLPSGTYWRRRLAMLSVALILALAFGKVLTHFSDGAGGDGQAAQTATTTRSSFPPPGSSASATSKATRTGSATGSGKRRGRRATASPTTGVTDTPTPTPVVDPATIAPTGTCAADDVYITPTVVSAVAGSPVTITLNLQTQQSAACTWKVSPDSVGMKIATGADDVDTVWTSQQCPKVIPTQDVVVRQAVATQVTVTWDGKRSNQYCTGRTAFVLTGTYDVYAAALGGEPTDVAFALTSPVAPQVTETVTPTPTASGTSTPSAAVTTAPTPAASNSATPTPTADPTATPSATPSKKAKHRSIQ